MNNTNKKEVIYAKSNPKETLKEHTDGLLSNIKFLKKTYGKKILARCPAKYRNIFWDVLILCAKYHDLGKISIFFQNEIRTALGEQTIKDNLKLEVQHNYLSPAFFSRNVLSRYKPEIQRVIVQSIFYHHDRGTPNFVNIEKVIKLDLEKRKEYAGCLIDSMPDKLWVGYENFVFPRINSSDETYNLYVLIMGLLKKADHTASGHCAMEIVDHSLSKKTLRFLNKFPDGPRNLQIWARDHRRNSTVVVASTGMGKTEASFMWTGEEKMCYFLPLRVATNAIFDRAANSGGINYQNAGLLHSSSAEHLDESHTENVYSKYKNSRQLIDPIVFSTVDQLFIYPFCYLGYEKVLATLSYSKVVVDEIQSYDPKIAAVVLYGLKELQDLGGRFMLMTATLPKFYLDMLKSWGVKFDYKEFLSPLKRHKLQMFERDLLCDIQDIAEDGKKKKVLVIVNTIAKANSVCEKLKAQGCEAKLFHALFNGEDRRRLENEVALFSDTEDEDGVWVTTQIVEASLDIDFDVLYTEFSSPDSLFQRMGRVFRDRDYKKNGPNVKVYTELCSGIETIYDKKIFNISKEEMKEFVEGPKYITEQKKQDIVNKVYSEGMLKGTTYYKTFNEALDVLKNLSPYSVSKAEAHDLFRDINSYQTIPEGTYQEFKDEIFKQIGVLNSKNSSRDEKMYARRYLSDKSVNVPAYRVNKKGVIIKEIDGVDDLYRINCLYSEDQGLILNKLYSSNLA